MMGILQTFDDAHPKAEQQEYVSRSTRQRSLSNGLLLRAIIGPGICSLA
jgi:hypothetical protein